MDKEHVESIVGHGETNTLRAIQAANEAVAAERERCAKIADAAATGIDGVAAIAIKAAIARRIRQGD
jgi:hypothetical protein